MGTFTITATAAVDYGNQIKVRFSGQTVTWASSSGESGTVVDNVYIACSIPAGGTLTLTYSGVGFTHLYDDVHPQRSRHSFALSQLTAMPMTHLYSSNTALIGPVIAFPRNLTTLTCSNTAVTGPVIDFPRSLTNLYCGGTAVTGPVIDFPRNLTTLYCNGTAATGSVMDFPRSLTILYCHNTAVTGPVGFFQTNTKFYADNTNISKADLEAALIEWNNNLAGVGCIFDANGTNNPTLTKQSAYDAAVAINARAGDPNAVTVKWGVLVPDSFCKYRTPYRKYYRTQYRKC